MPLQKLLDHMKQTAALSQVSGLIAWDQETMMPERGAKQRAEQAGAMASVVHARESDPRISEWLSQIDCTLLSEFDRCNVEQARRSHLHATRIPESLASEMAKASAEGQMIWTKAREKRDFSMFAPALKKLVELKRHEAACLAQDGMTAYDALLDQFEPGSKTKTLQPLLESLRKPLVSLRERISEKPKPEAISGHFAKEKQLELATRVASQLGYDFAAGRIDISTHPFSSGSGGDSRITTRTDEADPLNCLYSTIHEVGHALYSQGKTDLFLPAAEYCSMGVHESQSRFWENQIARSLPFAHWLFPEMKSLFPDMNVNSPEEFYAAVNKVETGYIRTEADEVHYNLHVLLRFELEQAMIAGDLEVEGLESEWNLLFNQYFGQEVNDIKLGVLQDVHWSVGLFGYFPTYSVGNIYSACLDGVMRKEMPGRDEQVAKGETGEILSWLRERIHSKGRLHSAPELIELATGEPPSTKPLIDYLENKFTNLYSL